jgi:hypothetical protein
MRYCAPKAILVGVLAMLTGCGENNTPTGPAAPTAPTGGGIRVGLWEGTLPSAPLGSGTLSFRVTSQTSMTFVETRVPTFGNQAGCAFPWSGSAWNSRVTIGSNHAFSTTLADDDLQRFAETWLDIEGIFDRDTAASGTIIGKCKNEMVLPGQTFRANWVSN